MDELSAYFKSVDIHKKAHNLLTNSFVQCKIFPINYTNEAYILKTDDRDMVLVDDKPYPTNILRENYGDSIDDYIDNGNLCAKSIVALFNKHKTNLKHKPSILDWGCASGRVIRWLPKRIDANLYGCDINCNYINWCQKYLNNTGIFTQCTTYPHLPFKDGSFDLIYGLSIFTHIDQLIDMWLLELKRVLADKGVLVVTIHDTNAYELINRYQNDTSKPESVVANIIKQSYGMTLPPSNTFYRMSAGNSSPRGNFMFFSDNNIKHTFGKIFDIRETLSIINEEQYEIAINLGNFQTTYVLIKE